MPLRAPTEGAYAAMALHLLPAGLVGLVLVAICASTMSTLDLSLTGLAGLITQNIYPALCRLAGATPREGRARLVLGRVVNLCCALVVISIAQVMAALGSGGVFSLMIKLMAQVTAPIGIPLMWGMFIRRVPTWATPLAIIVGFVVSSGIEYAPAVLGMAPWVYWQQILALFAASSLVFLGGCVVYRRGRPDPAVEAREAEFFARWRRPVDFAAEIGAGNDGRQMRVIGRFGLAMAAAILLLLLPASSAGHAGKILLIAGGTAAVGFALTLGGRGRTAP